MDNTPWDEKDVEKLKEMWPDNSARAIARTLGKSRNAILGKANRLNLGKSQSEMSAVNTDPLHRYAGSYRIIKKSKPLAADTRPPFSYRLMDLRLGMCKWPQGSGDYTFCGERTNGDSPYCERHYLRSVRRDARQ